MANRFDKNYRYAKDHVGNMRSFAGAGKGDWAPDHGGPRYHIKTKHGEIQAFDTHRGRGLEPAVNWLHDYEKKRKDFESGKSSRVFTVPFKRKHS